VVVYPKQMVFCPKAKAEQNGIKCKTCEHYNDHNLKGRLFIKCNFDKQAGTTDLCQ